jgi:hypothetical protein
MLPTETLPIALHEAAHFDHLCAPVGMALAAIHLRVRQLAFALRDQSCVGSGKADIVRELIEWRQRYETVTTVLRPISEGLACIAEFDVMARKVGESTSFPMQFAATVAARDVLRPAALEVWLTPARVTHESVTKSNLYADGFHCRNGGYLPGYLLMRSTWARCASIDPRFDADTFLSTIRYSVFSDYRLVNLILSPPADPTALAKELISRICDRLTDALELKAAYDRLHGYRLLAAEYSSKSSTRPRSISNAPHIRRALKDIVGHAKPKNIRDADVEALLFNDAADVVAGFRQLQKCIEVSQSPNPLFPDEKVVALNRAVWKRRGWFWLGSFPVTLTAVGDDIFCSGTGGVTGRLPLLSKKYRQYFGSGWLTCAYSSKRAATVIAAGFKQKVIAAASHWGPRDETFSAAMRLLGEQSALLELDDEVRRLVDESLSQWTTQLAIDDVQSAASSVVTRKIAEAVLSSTHDTDVDAFLAATRNDGLAGLTSADLLRACALLSICGSSGMSSESIRLQLEERGYYLSTVIQRVSEFLEPIGGHCRFDGDHLQISL